MKTLKFDNVKTVIDNIQPGEVVVINEHVTNDADRLMRCYLCYGTYYSLAQKYLKYESIVKRAAAAQGKSIESVVAGLKSNPDNLKPQWFYVRAIFNKYPSVGFSTDHTVQFMQYDKALNDFYNAKNEIQKFMCFISGLVNNIENGQSFIITTDSIMQSDIDTFMKDDHTFLYASADDFGYCKKDLATAINNIELVKKEVELDIVSKNTDNEYAIALDTFRVKMQKKDSDVLKRMVTIMEELTTLGRSKDDDEGLLYEDEIKIINEVLHN